MRFPDVSPTTKVSFPPPGLPAVLGVIDALTASLAGLRLAVESMGAMGSGRLLTCEQYIQRIGGRLTVETLQDWIKHRRHGRFRHVQDFGKAGYRIPEAYLFYTDEQIDQLFGGFAGGPATGSSPAAVAMPVSEAERGVRVGVSAGAGAPKRGRGRLAIERHPAEAVLDGVFDD